MNGKYLLDTNIVIALYADDAMVKDNLAKADQIRVVRYLKMIFGLRPLHVNMIWP